MPVLGDEIAKLGANPLQAEVDSLRLALASARTAAEQAQRDAERMDWLETQVKWDHYAISVAANVRVEQDDESYDKTLRAAIDAARSLPSADGKKEGG